MFYNKLTHRRFKILSTKGYSLISTFFVTSVTEILIIFNLKNATLTYLFSEK